MSDYPWRDLYQFAMRLGLPRSEFWSMSPDEFSDWANAVRPMQQYGAIDEKQAQSLTDRIKANPDKYL